VQEATSLPSGLQYLPAYISFAEQEQLLATIGQQPWLADLKRRVQHYGYRYDYKNRAIDAAQRLGPLPDWTRFLGERFVQSGLLERQPDQLIVNEYEVGQGISAHIDCRPCFGETILSLSLNSTCTMLFSHATDKQQYLLFLEPCSLVVMQGEARHQWKHSIPSRKTDQHKGQVFARGRRVSLTFRHVIL
jgi:alkylated DNA repair dioxygenase AlkB